MNQAPSAIFMVRPDHFAFNPETARSNAFQNKTLICENNNIRQHALEEFHAFVALLKKHNIEVFVFDSPQVNSPDAVFPNNWISFHEDGKVILYPMLTQNRKIEMRPEIVDEIGEKFHVEQLIDLSSAAQKGKILEGTGSIVFDHINKFAYANESSRTNKNLFYDVCELLAYEGVFFKAVDLQGIDIYHTNVLMTIGEGYAIICKEAIDKSDAAHVINNLQSSGLEVIEISHDQMNHFAGNMIQLKSKDDKKWLVMSETAHNILDDSQKHRLSNYTGFIHADIHTIESIGGGSARCMIAGIRLNRKSLADIKTQKRGN
jgi:hypothetical protein